MIRTLRNAPTTMTVAELKSLLESLPHDMPVYLSGPGGNDSEPYPVVALDGDSAHTYLDLRFQNDLRQE